MAQTNHVLKTYDAKVTNPEGQSSVVLVCEHASRFIPPEFDGLGLAASDRESHAVWDPGAVGVARALSAALDAVLIEGTVSRLVFDCNRPPEASDAMPAQSEVVRIPGNAALTEGARRRRAEAVYHPFHRTTEKVAANVENPIIVTIHSFTPVYHGEPRQVEIGVLHDADLQLADAMLDRSWAHTKLRVRRNAPYGPRDGVTHILQRHGTQLGRPNVMIELRNDLITSEADQQEAGEMLARWIADAARHAKLAGSVECKA